MRDEVFEDGEGGDLKRGRQQNYEISDSSGRDVKYVTLFVCKFSQREFANLKCGQCCDILYVSSLGCNAYTNLFNPPK